ncbi:hypothetical protein FPZ24_09175 [Sphingomonas panacisoli]|uniref:DUF4139 domain-containing protein n=1 Tax=Sphingomonas panacisoli TaxID=1813879 RepID=A0A5B8LHW0_9SPHN|nr:hypothetical protein [Sphingomonas panacisoli]QDZ07641.1 hypothetical protein FPZ24_09175 [Sphingomonas panacisoli]
MRKLVVWFLATLFAAAPPAAAQTIVTSAGPDHVSVTLYRAPNRGPEDAVDRDDPEGYALVTETRAVTIPAGDAVIRFEGVAGNILPESALIAGLPNGVEEKNLDANLLSPRSLFDRALGRRVMVRRTDPGTGKVQYLQATLRSSSEGAAVLQFSGDYGDLRCSGMPETLIYAGIPPGLSARPTLSVRTHSASEQKLTLTLSYLAGGFDWQADYVVTMRPDGRSADLFAWITLASSDVTNFPDADLQVVAGKPNRNEDQPSFGPDAGDLSLKCWPMPDYDYRSPEPPPPPALPSAMIESESMDIVITGSLIQRRGAMSSPIAITASAEQLGDLKLYRFPRRVTVASNGQKQVGMLNKPKIKLLPIYRSTIRGDGDYAQTEFLLRSKNVTANGLGVPLPAGKAAIFANAQGRTLMVGEASIDDKTIGEDIEFSMGEPGAVDADIDTVREKDKTIRYDLTVTNANAWPIDYEASFDISADYKLRSPSAKLGRKDSRPLWTTRIPANGKVKLSYTIVEQDEEDN